jgi:hypothetical protein
MVERNSFQRFWQSHLRQFAPSWARSRKNPEKIANDEAETGGKWRFSKGLERHFAGLGADGPRSQATKLPDFTSVGSVASGHLRPDRSAIERHWLLERRLASHGKADRSTEYRPA